LARDTAATPFNREIGDNARKHTRAQSSVTNILLIKRMALRETPHRPLRQWDFRDTEKLLHRFYNSAATWKTVN
jgi:hypothetical protein